jgi:hypothetical protein
VLDHDQVTETYGGYEWPVHYFSIDTGNTRIVHYAVTGNLIGDPILTASNSFHDWSSPSIVSANPFSMSLGRYYRLTLTVQDPTRTSGRAVEEFYFGLRSSAP